MPVYVNHVEITDEQVFREMQYHPSASPQKAMQCAAEALTIRELLLQEAAARGMVTHRQDGPGEPEADDKRIEQLLLEAVKVPEPDELTCRRFYDQNHTKFIRAGKAIPFAEVKPLIASYLQDTSWHTAVRQYIMILVGRATIAGLTLKGADSPLVQ